MQIVIKPDMQAYTIGRVISANDEIPPELNLTVEPSDTIRSLKVRIQEILDVPISRQWLTFAGQPLDHSNVSLYRDNSCCRILENIILT
jgi:hypothetical protein